MDDEPRGDPDGERDAALEDDRDLARLEAPRLPRGPWRQLSLNL